MTFNRDCGYSRGNRDCSVSSLIYLRSLPYVLKTTFKSSRWKLMNLSTSLFPGTLVVFALVLFLPMTALTYFVVRRQQQQLEKLRILSILDVDNRYKRMFGYDFVQPTGFSRWSQSSRRMLATLTVLWQVTNNATTSTLGFNCYSVRSKRSVLAAATTRSRQE